LAKVNNGDEVEDEQRSISERIESWVEQAETVLMIEQNEDSVLERITRIRRRMVEIDGFEPRKKIRFLRKFDP
jgi:hypothetical protein